jgi:hypothetical protein
MKHVLRPRGALRAQKRVSAPFLTVAPSTKSRFPKALFGEL